MNQEKTKHKFHEVLKWIDDGETIEYSLWNQNLYKDCTHEEVRRHLMCKDKYIEFRIKPKTQIIRADVTYVAFGDSGNCTVDLIYENTEAKQLLYKMAQLRERMVILTEQCYNELLGNSTLNSKGN